MIIEISTIATRIVFLKFLLAILQTILTIIFKKKIKNHIISSVTSQWFRSFIFIYTPSLYHHNLIVLIFSPVRGKKSLYFYLGTYYRNITRPTFQPTTSAKPFGIFKAAMQ